MPDLSTLATLHDSTTITPEDGDSFMLDGSTAETMNDPVQSFPQPNHNPEKVQYVTDKPRHKPRLIQDTSGRSHYIGPSGSLSFFAELRQLISTRQPTSRFASDNLAEALEARPETENTHEPFPENDISSPATGLSTIECLRSASYLRSLPFQVLDDLLQLFFDKIHSDFPLFHRGLFLDRFERFFITNSTDAADCFTSEGKSNQSDDGWLISLHMTIAFGAMLRRATAANNQQEIGPTFHSIQTECWNVARAALSRLTTMCAQSHVQALLLIALYLHSISERNAAWVLVGCSARIGVAIGLHRTELHNSFPLIERETRKRIWCTLYGFEQFLCLSLGRPSAIDDEEVKASVPSDDIMSSGSGPPGCTEFKFYLYQLCPKLRKTMSIHYRTSDGNGSGATTDAVLHELSLWERKLPLHLHLPKDLVDQKIPSESNINQLHQFPAHHLHNLILLHIQYNELVLSATRPYLLLTISTSFQDPSGSSYPWNTADPSVQDPKGHIWKFARTCVSSAFRVANLTLVLDHLNLLNGLTWLDVYYSYSAAMVLLLRVLWVPSSGSSQDILLAEKSSKDIAIQVVTAIRKALRRISKSSTTHRFSSVVERFADVVTNSVLPTIQQQISGPDHDSNVAESYTNVPTDDRSFLQTNRLQAMSHCHNDSISAQANIINQASYGQNIAQIQYPLNQATVDVHHYREDNALTEAARVISSFSQDPMYAETMSWDDPFQSVTQHILDWNDFEQFLGRWSSG